MKQTSVLQVGAARVCITPPLGTPLFGYPVNRPAEAVGDDLDVIAAAVVSGDTKAMLMSADICLCSEDTVNEIKKQITEQTGFPGECVVYNTTHTHSGPDTSGKISGWGESNDSYIQEILIPRSVEAAVNALAALRPVQFGVGTTESNMGINRRTMTPDGTVGLGQNPWGLMDKEMTVLSFRDAQTKQMYLNIVHYGCHGTASGRSIEITRDWPGMMKDVMERETGALTMFLQGSIGEVGPRCPNGDTTQSYTVAKELGYGAGMDAVRAWRSIKHWSNAPVTVACGDVVVPYDPLPSKEDAQAEMDKLGTEEELWAKEERFKLNEFYRWKRIVAEYDKGEPLSNYIFKQCIVSIGDVAIVPFQFEMFLYTPLQLRRYSQFTHTLSLSVTNGNRAYLPSQDQICRGGYEVWQFRYGNTYKLVDNADCHLVTENLKLLDQAYADYTEKL